ncbi:hypothetical protein PMAN_a1142 [Pseudoalteromonas marina]|nr:hypothetical protein PMAN_a1142 [Pseudoalteromonas marina]
MGLFALCCWVFIYPTGLYTSRRALSAPSLNFTDVGLKWLIN